jgi:hypothetical protein
MATMKELLTRILNPASIRLFLGRNKRRYGRGTEFISILLLIIANAKLFETTFDKWAVVGISIGFWGGVIVIGSAYLSVCWVIGWIDERWGFWKQDNDYCWIVTPLIMKLCDNAEATRSEVTELKTSTESLARSTELLAARVEELSKR